MTTHYIPYFTRENGRKREAACGAWIELRDHSTEPGCDNCKRWLAEQSEDDAETMAALGMKLVDGLMVPKEIR